MNAMLWNAKWVLIFWATPSYSFEIWLWMYICHVSDVHLPNFLIVESLYPMILSAMAPPARRECAPIKSGSIPLSCRLSDFVAVRTALTISWLSTECHLLLGCAIFFRLGTWSCVLDSLGYAQLLKANELSMEHHGSLLLRRGAFPTGPLCGSDRLHNLKSASE